MNPKKNLGDLSFIATFSSIEWRINKLHVPALMYNFFTLISGKIFMKIMQKMHQITPHRSTSLALKRTKESNIQE